MRQITEPTTGPDGRPAVRYVEDDPELGIAAGSEFYVIPVDPADATNCEACQ